MSFCSSGVHTSLHPQEAISCNQQTYQEGRPQPQASRGIPLRTLTMTTYALITNHKGEMPSNAAHEIIPCARSIGPVLPMFCVTSTSVVGKGGKTLFALG
jgi:hypothetical protein